MKLSLSELKWEVKGYWPYVPVKEKSMETGQTLHGVTGWIPARVPGGVHFDLWKAGLIENPYYGKNSLKCEWVENRWWMYRTAFPAELKGCDLRRETVRLVFAGLDYEASVFLNDELIGEHTGMYDAFCAELTGRIREENRLVVLLRGAPQEMGQIGYTSRTSTQKSRFNYKWDFSTRLVNIGIWREAELQTADRAEIEDLHIDTGYSQENGFLYFSGHVSDRRAQKSQPLKARITVGLPAEHNSADVGYIREMNGDSPIEGENCGKSPCVRVLAVDNGSFEGTLTVKAPALWYPNGAGRQFLYSVTIELIADENGEERVLHRTDKRTGFRSLSMAHNEREHENALPYTFVINGRKLYIRGVNLTPLDHLYGNVTDEQYAFLVAAMVNAGVNLVRVWGGGLIEKEIFYNLCDENGILIWQEFIQSSSGIDNKPCEDAGFLSLLKTAATAAVREKRNHVSLAVYSGGNELMEAPDSPCSMENKNIGMLKRIVEDYDGRRPFLPTSASGPREFVSREKGVSHDVHGNWRYEGNPGHYELYGNSDSLFHSEFGMDAACGEKSLKRFLPDSALKPTPMSGDENWQHHGEWWGTYFRDCEMFGPIERTAENLLLFTRCSQYMQSEGLRFILEANRRRAFQNSGVIIWQLNEPWPNASCTNLIDYYGETKTAYYHVKRAYEQRHISLDYRSLSLNCEKTRRLPVWVSNGSGAFEGRARLLVRSLRGRILQEAAFEISAAGNRSTRAGELTLSVSEEPLYFVTAVLETDGRTVSENTYMFGTSEETVFAPLLQTDTKIEITAVKTARLEDERMRAAVTVRNSGARAAMDAGVELLGSRYLLLGRENDIALFPGEEKTLEFLLIPSCPGVFWDNENRDEGKEPVFQAHWL